MIIKLPKLEQWQKDVFNDCERFEWRGSYVVKSTRQIGKSFFANYLLLYYALKYPRTTSLLVSPVIAQSRKMYTEISHAVSRIAQVNGTLLEIKIKGGGRIIFRSAEQGDNLRGMTVSGVLVMDEAAYISDDFFYSVVLPMTNVYHAPLFMFSTPRFKVGFFYSYFLNSDGTNHVYDWTSYNTSKYLSEERINEYRKSYPTIIFNREILGMFSENEGCVFPPFVQEFSEYNKNLPIYVGVDWGASIGKDYTAVALSQIENGVLYVREVDFFNTIPPEETIDRIISKIIGYPEQYLIVEKNSIGNIYLQLLLNKVPKDTSVRAFNTTNKSKDVAIKKLTNLIEKKKIILPIGREINIELSTFESKVTSLGIVIYGAPDGLHDDIVMAVALLSDMVYYELQTNP